MEAIVGLGIIEAFSYVLLYYTFIHSLNRYERKKDAPTRPTLRAAGRIRTRTRSNSLKVRRPSTVPQDK